MIIQVPLRVPGARVAVVARPRSGRAGSVDLAAPAAAAADKPARRRRSDVEVAVLGHGPELGPYTELDGLTIERDPRFPVRVTVQFYQATSNGVLAVRDVENLRAQIKKVYAMADYVGSLVVPIMTPAGDELGRRLAPAARRDDAGLPPRPMQRLARRQADAPDLRQHSARSDPRPCPRPLPSCQAEARNRTP